jgi:hypothetical protein
MQIAFFAVAKIPASERLCFRQEDLQPYSEEAATFWLYDWTSALCRIVHVLHCSRHLWMSMSRRRDSLGRLRRLAKFFNWSLGAIITTIVASIAWQLVASASLSPSCPTFYLHLLTNLSAFEATVSALGPGFWLDSQR